MKTARNLNLNDEQLVRNYLGGDNNSLGILYDRYYSKVYYKCLSFTHDQDDAFDLAQDILMKAFSNVETFKEKSKFSTWLFSITSNHCISQSAKSKKECCLDVHSAYKLIADDQNEEEYNARCDREEIEFNIGEYLNLLPSDDRKILELKYLHNYSVKDLQKELGLSMSAVKMRLLRARQRIEQIISTGQKVA
jgi:RNA polymerase sigma-70 factor (ECF subfamily)